MGSSPLTRGKQSGELASVELRRLIPAHAGKTSRRARRRARSAAHPRSRGENGRIQRRCAAHSGSSPLTRGKPTNLRWQVPQMGLIPAHAGKTTAWERRLVMLRAHPRSRGENSIVRPLRGAARGSSPLTRGKQSLTYWVAARRGLIPAHAGKTASSSMVRRIIGAHPRSRGENVAVAVLITCMVGSSPLTRGKQSRWKRAQRLQGLIPAHAGKTPQKYPHREMSRAHPRSRGENATPAKLRVFLNGSSPLTRGKRVVDVAPARAQGLIPAHAGKTLSAHQFLVPSWAHPRSRGENAAGLVQDEGLPGLIPAHAGKTSRPNWR